MKEIYNSLIGTQNLLNQFKKHGIFFCSLQIIDLQMIKTAKRKGE